MAILNAFKYNQDVKYRAGGVYKTQPSLGLVSQTIMVNKKGFNVIFPNVWFKYKLPPISKETYLKWTHNPMQFWQNQLNFAIWCARCARLIPEVASSFWIAYSGANCRLSA